MPYTESMLVLGMGNACLDTQLSLERLPGPGGKAPVVEQRHMVGGQIAGALVGCRRLGLEARFLLRSGDDDPGQRLRDELKAEGMGLAYSRVLAGVPTASAWILRDSSGERIVLWSTDPRLAVQPDEVTPELFDGVAALLFDGRDGPACLRAARLARARNIPVIGDLDCHYPHTPELLPWIDHLVVPESFAPPPPSPRHVVVVTRGAQGATGREHGGAAVESPAFAVPVTDTTGAGDAFHAGYIFALLQGWNLAERLRFAHAAAALACGAVGALAGLPRRRQVEALLASGAAQ